MAESETLQDLIRVTEELEKQDLPYMVVGAFAVMAHGYPRTTADIDIAVAASFEHRTELGASLERLGFGAFEDRQDEFGMRIVGRRPGGLPVEVFFVPSTPLRDREFSRRVRAQVGPSSFRVISPEDLLLRKLVNTRIRRGVDFDDAISVLATQGSRIDMAYLHRHCAVHRVCRLLDQAVAAAKKARRP